MPQNCKQTYSKQKNGEEKKEKQTEKRCAIIEPAIKILLFFYNKFQHFLLLLGILFMCKQALVNNWINISDQVEKKRF